jgi:hypothetical protein
MTTLILYLSYALLLPAKLLAGLRGRDPLQLKDDPSRTSYWVPRPVRTDAAAYFSESSPAEDDLAAGRADTANLHLRPAGRLALKPLLWLARRQGPGRTKVAVSASDRDKGVPDEIYTLW